MHRGAFLCESQVSVRNNLDDLVINAREKR